MQREIRKTGDGFPTFFVPALNEHYHSIHGAYQESMHVFIEAGLIFQFNKTNRDLNILEIGLGTGLNAILTLETAGKYQRKIEYEALEPFPLTAEEVQTIIAQSDILSQNSKDLLEKIHGVSMEAEFSISPFFLLKKHISAIENYKPDLPFDLVYFDAFGPQAQPEIWSEENFKKIYLSMKSGGVLVTYSAKGSVRRALQSAGFTTERIPGPPGKREMLRAIKK